jgi:hypothetical protein
MIALLFLVMVPSLSFADMPPVYQEFETPYGDFSAWGHFGQGFVWNDRYSFFGSEDDAFGYREVSLGGQYRFLDRYSVNVQGEYRTAGESDTVGLRLGQAFLDGSFIPGESTIVGANLGASKSPLGYTTAHVTEWIRDHQYSFPKAFTLKVSGCATSF